MGLVWYDWDGSVLIASSNQLNKRQRLITLLQARLSANKCYTPTLTVPNVPVPTLLYLNLSICARVFST